ncbi:MAG: ABC transporter ATP-binding protein [Lachnospiraceae bacterium]|nr:ABC transporter ATP-binding protein [Lachnospiraceae bacterium]
MKKTFSELWKLLSLMKKDYPLLKIFCFIDAVTTAFSPYVQLVFYARILRFLLARDFPQAVTNAAVMIGLTLLLSLIHRVVGARLASWQNLIDETSINEQLSAKSYVMEYDHLERTETLDRIRSADYLRNGSGGVDYVVTCMIKLISAALSFVCALLFLFRLFVQSAEVFRIADPALWALAFGFVLVLLTGMLTAKKEGVIMNDLMQRNAHGNAVSGYLINTGLGVSMKKDLLVYGMADMLATRFKEYVKQTGPVYMAFGKQSGVLTSVRTFAMNVYAACGYVFVGLRALSGAIPVSDVLLYAGALQRLTSACEELVKNYMSIKMRLEYLMQFYDFIHQEPMHYTGTLPVEKRSDGDYELEFRDVSFTYPETEEEVLSHVNLKFKVGQKMALVGRNGAGKSTIVKLLCRLYEPTEGEILLNGIDIRKYDYAEYTTVFAPVFQDFKLFSLPVRDNITCGYEADEAPWTEAAAGDVAGKDNTGDTQENTSDRRIWEALEKAGIAERVREMKDGLETLLYHDNGEGIDVSGGEAQRLAIARAWYKNAPFLILDEPTAALDPLTEAQIYEHFNELVGQKTAIYISHRMSSCKFCDEIVVFDKGHIVERGTHDSLLADDGVYAKLFNTQAAYYQTA